MPPLARGLEAGYILCVPRPFVRARGRIHRLHRGQGGRQSSLAPAVPPEGLRGSYNNEVPAIGEKWVTQAVACPAPLMVTEEAGHSTSLEITKCLSTSCYMLSVCRQTSHLACSDQCSRLMGCRRVCCR